LKKFSSALETPAKPTEYTSLSAQENELMGSFMAMDKEMRDTMLAEVTALATAEARRQRTELF
jgi:hypothetical protein